MNISHFMVIPLLIGVGMVFALTGCKNTAKAGPADSDSLSVQSKESSVTWEKAIPLQQVRDTVINNEDALVIKGKFMENDTLFFMKGYETIDGKSLYAEHIYMEYDTAAYDNILNTTMEYFEKECEHSVAYWLTYTNNKPSLRKVDLLGLPTEWIPLHYYEGEACVYASCEVDVPFQRRLTDSLLIHRDMELSFFPLLKSDKPAQNVYHFELYAEKRGSDVPSAGFTDVYIHIIDKCTQAAVWEYRKPGKESLYELMIPIESAKQFRLIVCDSWFHVVSVDMDFDEIDVKSLLESVQAGKKVDIYNL